MQSGLAGGGGQEHRSGDLAFVLRSSDDDFGSWIMLATIGLAARAPAERGSLCLQPPGKYRKQPNEYAVFEPN